MILKETGTKVVYSNFDTDETMLEKLSQAKGGDYDVVIADDYIIDSAVKEGLVQKIDKDTVSNFKNINPFIRDSFMIRMTNIQYLTEQESH